MSEGRDAGVRVDLIGDGRVAVRGDARSHLAYAVADGRNVWVWLDGTAYLVRAEAADRRHGAAADDMSLAAPMPATVRSIAVADGQRVSAGDVLVVLEAMKMELPVKAPRDGVVSAVRCAAGDLVQPGVPLIELE